jgi:hypothetical protein
MSSLLYGTVHSLIARLQARLTKNAATGIVLLYNGMCDRARLQARLTQSTLDSRGNEPSNYCSRSIEKCHWLAGVASRERNSLV